ncbi:two-partner secretion domain-containing protein, partial [Neisseria meningitidis]
NASRATLTTGQPQYQAGDLSGFKIRQGNVAITGQGLDARDTDFTQILSHAVKIDGPVWGKDVRVSAGKNNVSADGSIRSSHSPATNINSDNSLYAIDTGALGGDLCKIPFPPDSRNPNTGFRLFSPQISPNFT